MLKSGAQAIVSERKDVFKALRTYILFITINNSIMKDLGFNSPYALAGMCFALVSIAMSTFVDFTIKSAPTNPLGKYRVDDVRGARERPVWEPHDLYLEQHTISSPQWQDGRPEGEEVDVPASSRPE
jgi:hypothetical protein